MTKDWFEDLEKHLPPSVEHALKEADRAVHDFALSVHLSHWHPISTAPCNRELELRISEDEKILTLEFPCLRTNADEWLNVDLGTHIKIQPVEWRIWQHSKSPQCHHSKVKSNDRLGVVHPAHPSDRRHVSMNGKK